MIAVGYGTGLAFTLKSIAQKKRYERELAEAVASLEAQKHARTVKEEMGRVRPDHPVPKSRANPSLDNYITK